MPSAPTGAAIQEPGAARSAAIPPPQAGRWTQQLRAPCPRSTNLSHARHQARHHRVHANAELAEIVGGAIPCPKRSVEKTSRTSDAVIADLSRCAPAQPTPLCSPGSWISVSGRGRTTSRKSTFAAYVTFDGCPDHVVANHRSKAAPHGPHKVSESRRTKIHIATGEIDVPRGARI